jgi:hypothetical protein
MLRRAAVGVLIAALGAVSLVPFLPPHAPRLVSGYDGDC